jgi:hypothetical protein
MLKLTPSVWGPPMWFTIHIIALGYSSKPTYGDKKAAKEFFESLQFLIPCPQCREHYKEHLSKYPIIPHLDRKEDLFKYTVMLHNEVNKSLGKPTMLESEVVYFYRRIGARGKNVVVNLDTIDEVDLRSMIKGGLLGAGTVLVAGSLIWFATR